MYRMLIVDDEPRQVKALSNIITQLRPGYEVFSAEDGLQAMDFLTRNPVDILMTDIRMPNMDGLALIEALSRKGLKLKIVILSGYGEFEYAQKAIRSGVNDYLVKPISRTDLEGLLVKVEQSLREEQLQIQEEETLKKKLNSSLPVYLDRQLNRWIYGQLDKPGTEEIASIFPFMGSGVVLLSSADNSEQRLEKLKAAEAGGLQQYLKYLMKQALEPSGHTLSFFLEGFNGRMVTLLNSDQPFHPSSYDNLRRLNDVIRIMEQEYGIPLTIGISEKSPDIFRDAAKCFREALEAVGKRFYLGSGSVILHSPAKTSDPLVRVDFNAFETELSEAVHQRNTAMLHKITGSFFEGVSWDSGIEPRRMKEETVHVLLNLSKVVQPVMDTVEYSAFISERKDKILQCEDYRRLQHFVNEALGRIIDLLGISAGDKNRAIIEKCKKFIEENYMEDLSLEIVAQKYSFNPSYFSNLFKCTTRQGFSEYLMKIRIQKARELLINTDAAVAAVAARVGFRDSGYFNRMFKREVGISPLKFRQLSEKG